ncbi:hypothetical protein A0J61_00594 [Choanephora cucurbitarum]|uniref:Uncharacterized protein n=1 Tax=Choanephora cucurbitarum TaxID=101091 RepID=A0A1C7NQF5_9FUNG|nr:hypothetical protein A0J61_00594 [Choanephora cucurbitarum]
MIGAKLSCNYYMNTLRGTEMTQQMANVVYSRTQFVTVVLSSLTLSLLHNETVDGPYKEYNMEINL